jgi:hypothetical protein
VLTESQVISAVRQYLESHGFQVTRTLSEYEQGIDIQGTAPDHKKKISIEAKGETSSKAGSKRFGKPFSSGQVFDHVSKALYCASRDSSLGMLAGMAFPQNDLHIQCVNKIIPTLRQLGIEVFWVLPGGEVETERIWKINGI